MQTNIAVGNGTNPFENTLSLQSSLSFRRKKMPKQQIVQINPNPGYNPNSDSESQEEHEELGAGASLLFAFNSMESFSTYQFSITLAFSVLIVITLMVGNWINALK